jgi:transposase
MTVEERRRRRFSDEFRKSQVALYEAGKITIADICRLHQVKRENVMRWVKRFGTKPRKEQIVVSFGSEFDRLRELEKENKKLLGIIGQQQVELLYQRSLIDLAKDKLGEDFEKK